MTAGRRRYLLLVAQAAVSTVLLFLLFRNFDWPAFGRLFATIPIWFYVLSFTVVLAGQVLYAWRWKLILSALSVAVPFRAVVEQYLVGIFFNNFLPSTMGGDWAKVYYLGRSEGYVRVGASVVVDRVIGVFVLASMALAMAAMLTGPPRAVAAARGTLTFAWALLAGIIALAVSAPARKVWEWLTVRLAWLGRSADRLNRFLEHIRTAARHPSVQIGTGIVVCSYFAMLGLIYREFVVLMGGSTPAFLPVVAAVATITTLSNVPVAINGLGLREQLHFALLSALGLSKEAAAGISLLLFAHVLVISIAGAAVWARLPIAKGDRA